MVKPDLRLVSGGRDDTIHIMSEVNRWKQIYHCLMVKVSTRIKPEGYVEEHHILLGALKREAKKRNDKFKANQV